MASVDQITTRVPRLRNVTVADAPAARQMYALAPAHYVTVLAGGEDQTASYELMEVLAERRGGPPAQGFPRTTWFHVLEGQLQIFEEDRGWLQSSAVVTAGQSYAVAAGVPHTAHNSGNGPVRFLLGGEPGTVERYFAQVGEAAAAALSMTG